MTHNTRESAKKVLKEYYGYKSEQDVPNGLAAVLEDWLHHQLQKARGEDIHFRVTNYGTKKVDEMIAEAVHKARHDWLREEIVKLEGMKSLVAYSSYSTTGQAREAEKVDQALQTIIDRYHSELDQDNKYKIN